MSGVLSVGELNDYVQRSLGADPMLKNVQIRGEISNFKHQLSSGHWYFSLKDDRSRVDCVMYRFRNASVGFIPREGMKVVLTGSAGLYVVNGAFQFYADRMCEDGIGELYVRFEKLKRELMQEGLFDPARKRPLPLLPRMIGVVTSPTGAVIHDIARVTHRRNPGMQLVLRPARVQGEGAAEDIANGIRDLEKVPCVDVIIVGRGGGSIEDLWAFNEEIVARAVAACRVPVISAVGHETDTTISDLAADVRAATPSAAAELAVTPLEELEETLETLKRVLTNSTRQRILAGRAGLSQMEKRLQACHPLNAIQRMRSSCETAQQRMRMCARQKVMAAENRLTYAKAKLTALGPMDTMKRGYALVMNGTKTVTGVDELPGQVTLLFRDGRAEAAVTGTKRGDPFETGE